jgi:hypothetical protein
MAAVRAVDQSACEYGYFVGKAHRAKFPEQGLRLRFDFGLEHGLLCFYSSEGWSHGSYHLSLKAL